MLKLLLQPFPLYPQTGHKLRTALGFGLFVFLFLFIFRPFGLDEIETSSLALVSFLYGVVCFIILSIWFLLLPLLFPRIFRESVWTVWKEIVACLVCTLCICCGNIVLTHYYFHRAFSVRLVLVFLWMTSSVGILPIILMVAFRQMRLMKAYSREAMDLNRELAGKGVEVRETSEGVASEGVAKDFLYAEAADNYVKVFYRSKQELVRSSLKQLEEEFRGSERIFRCHRGWLVNLDKVIHISGNAQGYKLHLEGSDQVVPVSRALNGQIAKLVTRPKTPPIRPSDL